MKLIYEAPLNEPWPEFDHSIEWIPAKWRIENKLIEKYLTPKITYKKNKKQPQQRPQTGKPSRKAQEMQIYLRPSTTTYADRDFMIQPMSFPEQQRSKTVKPQTKFITAKEAKDENKNLMKFNQTFKPVEKKQPMFKRGWEKIALYEDPVKPFPIRGKLPDEKGIFEEDFQENIRGNKMLGLRVFKDDDEPPSPIIIKKKRSQSLNSEMSQKTLFELQFQFNETYQKPIIQINEEEKLKKKENEEEIKKIEEEIERLEKIAKENRKVKELENGTLVHPPKQGEQQFGVFKNKTQTNPYSHLEKELKRLDTGVTKLMKQIRDQAYFPGDFGKEDMDDIINEIKQQNKQISNSQNNKFEKLIEQAEKTKNHSRPQTALQNQIIQKQDFNNKLDNKMFCDEEILNNMDPPLNSKKNSSKQQAQTQGRKNKVLSPRKQLENQVRQARQEDVKQNKANDLKSKSPSPNKRQWSKSPHTKSLSIKYNKTLQEKIHKTKNKQQPQNKEAKEPDKIGQKAEEQKKEESQQPQQQVNQNENQVLNQIPEEKQQQQSVQENIQSQNNSLQQLSQQNDVSEQQISQKNSQKSGQKQMSQASKNQSKKASSVKSYQSKTSKKMAELLSVMDIQQEQEEQDHLSDVEITQNQSENNDN